MPSPRRPTTSWSSAPAPAAWPPPCPRPATARACSSSTDDPARPACPAPPASTCARWRSSAPGASPTPCARAPIRVVPEAASAATLVAPPRSSGRAGGYPAPREILDVSPVAAAGLPAGPARAGPRRRRAARRAARSGSAPRSSPCTVRPDGVRAELGSGPTASHARFVVGADGTRSTVRAALGIGTTHLGTWAHAVQVLFRPAARRCRQAAPAAHLRRRAARRRRCAPMGAGRWAYVACGSTAAGPTSRDDWTPTLRAATGLPDLDRRGPRRPAVHAGRRGRHDLPRRPRVPRRRRRAPDDPGRRDRPEHRDPRRPRAGLEARVGGPRPGRRRAAREPRRRARPRSGWPPPRARSTCRAARPTACRAPWATRTAPP